MMVTPQAAFADMPMPRVLVTIEPLKPYVDDILKGLGESVSLLRGSQDPHTTVLSPSQALAIKQADIIIMPSEGMAPGIARVVKEKKKEGARVIELVKLSGAEAKPYPKANPWLIARKKVTKEEEPKEKAKEEAHDHDHADEEAHAAEKKKVDDGDPHLWLDPVRMAAVAVPLAQAIGQDMPYYQPTLNANARTLARHLREEVHAGIKTMLKTRKNNPPFSNQPYVPFLTYHASYQYFLGRYQLGEAGYLNTRPAEYFGAKSLHGTLEGAEDINLRCLISENESNMVKRIAEAGGARVILLNPERGYAPQEVGIAPWAKNDYERLLFKVAESFASCL